MSIRHLGAAARVIGRRNALRYLALGAGSALVAACSSGGSGGGTAGGAAGGDGGQGATSVADAVKPTVADRAFDAFMRGGWNIRTSTSRGKPLTGKAEVQTDGGGNGGWTITWDGLSGKSARWHGTFLLRGGHLSLTVAEGPDKLVRERPPQALDVPATVGGDVKLTLPWQPPGSGDSSGENLAVTYDGTTLTIVHTSGSSRTTHTCTRA